MNLDTRLNIAKGVMLAGYTHDQVARAVGVSRPAVTQSINKTGNGLKPFGFPKGRPALNTKQRNDLVQLARGNTYEQVARATGVSAATVYRAWTGQLSVIDEDEDED